MDQSAGTVCYDSGDETLQVRSPAVSNVDDLLFRQGLVQNAGGHVGNERERQHLQSAVGGGDDLRDGGHAHGVGAQGPEGPDFRRRFIAGAGAAQVHTLLQREAQGLGGLLRSLAQSGRIRIGHIAEAGAERRVVGTDEGIGSHEVDMILNEHQVAHLEAGVDAAGGIGHDQRCHAQLLHHPHGENDIGQCVALVEMEAALHADDGFSAEAARHELALVAGAVEQTKCGISP